MRQFKCYTCGKQSRFLHQKHKVEIFAEFKTILSTDETRTYECERCSMDNRITQPKAAWDVIDSDQRL